MTMQIPTSEALSAGARNPASQAGGTLFDGAPPGLPDAADLARLATQFFAALPGAALPGAAGSGAGLLPPAAAAPAPGLAPGPIHDSVPAPGDGKRPAVPVVPAIALPIHVSGAPASSSHVPASPAIAALAPPPAPYYFLEAAKAEPSRSGAAAIATPRLPGVGDLQGLLGGEAGARSGARFFAPAGAFYFIDPTRDRGADAVPNISAAGVPVMAAAHPPFDVHAIRADFPILQERVNGRQLVWFDNAATTQKPQAVIDRLACFYAHENSNIHRAAHELAARASDAYEEARKKVARFLGAGAVEEIVFVRGATEAINLVAHSWGGAHIGEGDEIIVSHLEHHANIVPWQQLAMQKGARLRVIEVDDSGQVLLDQFQRLLNSRTRLVAITQVSNALGTVVPVGQIIDLAHRAGARVLVDGAQSVSHMAVDVRALDADFFVFSGHKVFAPTGIGALYAKRELLEAMAPYQFGGNMIADVRFDRTLFQAPPARFEAGTGNIADAVGLGAAIDYVERIGLDNIGRYEHDLLSYATDALQRIPGLRLIGTARDKASVLSFVLEGHETGEVGDALNREGIAVRSGHHCAQPILRRFGVESTVRPSLAFYNTCEEVDRLAAVLAWLAAQRRLVAR